MYLMYLFTANSRHLLESLQYLKVDRIIHLLFYLGYIVCVYIVCSLADD